MTLRAGAKLVEYSYRDLLRRRDRARIISDFHCVTGWSVLDQVITGIRLADLLDEAFGDAWREGGYRRLFGRCLDGFTSTLRIADVLRPTSLLAIHAFDNKLEPKHGRPVRLYIPHLYGFKSAKWVTELTLIEDDRMGFWEIRGYDDDADPWLEQRYAGATGQDGLRKAQRAKTQHDVRED